MGSAEWFNVAALLIMFREALEAAVIIAVLLQLIVRLNMPSLKRWVWLGSIAGVVVSIILGIIFVLVFYLADTKLMDAKASAIFKGCICWTASLLITVVAFSMLKFYNLERKWKRKLQDAVQRSAHAHHQRWAMFLLAFSATLREGIESVLFLTGVSAGSSVKAVILPGLLGIVIGVLCGAIIYYSGKSIRSLKWFFILSAGLLLIIAAGMVVNGTMFFQNAGLFGAMWPYELRPWSNKILWNTTGCCDPDKNQFWALLRALFGYQATPLNLQLLYYCLFWVLTLLLLWYKARHGSLTDAKEAELEDQMSMARHKAEGANDGASDDSDPKLGVKASSTDLEAGSTGSDGSPKAAMAPPVMVGSTFSPDLEAPGAPAPVVKN